MNSSKTRRIQALKFLNKYVESPDESIDMLSLFGEYEDYILANAANYDMPIADFKRVVGEKFPNSEISGGTVNGIARRGARVRPAVQVDPVNSILINRCQSMASRFLIRHFTLEQLASYDEADYETLEPEQVLEWLNKSEFIYYNKNKNIYYFNQEV